MKTVIRALFLVGALSIAAAAKPVKLTKDQLAAITAGKITQTNNGGNIPNGNANGIPNSNPAGHEPPGQNK